jgi:hypothetical protein
MKRPPYRTVVVVMFGILAALVGLAFTGHWPAAAGSYPAFCGCIGVCVGAAAWKSREEHKANAGQPEVQK